MSKSSKKLGKLNIDLDNKIYSGPCEGALDPLYYIRAQMRNKVWYLAKIIDCRLLKDWDPKKRKNDAAYEYYVHYVDFNRRMDEWISRSRIELTRQLIEEDHMNKKKRKTEERKYDNNVDDEHEGRFISLNFFEKKYNFLFFRYGCSESSCPRTSNEGKNY